MAVVVNDEVAQQAAFLVHRACKKPCIIIGKRDIDTRDSLERTEYHCMTMHAVVDSY